jgi:hypothetical protein
VGIRGLGVVDLFGFEGPGLMQADTLDCSVAVNLSEKLLVANLVDFENE